VADRAHDGQPFRILNLIDEYSRKCLALRVRRELKAQDVVEVLVEQFFQKGLLHRPISDLTTDLSLLLRQSAPVAGKVWSQESIHRTWQSLGEWL